MANRTIELDEQLYVFLQGLVRTWARRATAQPTLGFRNELVALDAALSRDVPVRERKVISLTNSTSCPEHPAYTGQRRPRSGCQKCMTVYNRNQQDRRK